MDRIDEIIDDEKDNIDLQDVVDLKKYKTWTSLRVIGIWGVVVIVGMSLSEPRDSALLQFGPGDTKVAGILIDTWPRYIAMVLYVCFTQLCSAFIGSNLGSFMTNIVYDVKLTKIPMTYRNVMTTRLMYSMFEWMVGLSEILFFVSMQLQYIMWMAIVDILMKLRITHTFIHGKCTKGKYSEILPENHENIEPREMKMDDIVYT